MMKCQAAFGQYAKSDRGQDMLMKESTYEVSSCKRHGGIFFLQNYTGVFIKTLP